METENRPDRQNGLFSQIIQQQIVPRINVFREFVSQPIVKRLLVFIVFELLLILKNPYVHLAALITLGIMFLKLRYGINFSYINTQFALVIVGFIIIFMSLRSIFCYLSCSFWIVTSMEIKTE